MSNSPEDGPAARRGRPPGTSARELELVALDLFTRRGFEDTTIDQIAAAAGVSKRTFFRYFGTKADVLWHAFDSEVTAIRTVLDATPPELSPFAGVHRAVLAVNHYRAEDVPELRTRMALIGDTPELSASATRHYDAWEQEVARFVASRTGAGITDLVPQTVARVTLAAARAAYEQWLRRADAALTHYLDRALQLVALGLEPVTRGDTPDDASTSTGG